MQAVVSRPVRGAGHRGTAESAWGVFTPEPVARYITEWAVRTIGDHVLEHSCGEASFLLAAVDRLAELRGDALDLQLGALDGVELHEALERAAARRLLDQQAWTRISQVGDFFCVTPSRLLRRGHRQPALRPLPGLHRRGPRPLP